MEQVNNENFDIYSLPAPRGARSSRVNLQIVIQLTSNCNSIIQTVHFCVSI